MKKKILVIGASRGIGAEITKYFSKSGYEVIGVSRTPSSEGEWIQADISTVDGIQSLLNRLEQTPIEALIFSSGIWEEYGFTKEFDFRKTSIEETQTILSVNLLAPIEITKGLAKNLSNASNPRAIYLGALSGIDNRASDQVAYSSSKFGLRGAIQSLQIAFKEEGIGFTVINPGNVGTEEVMLDIQEGRFDEQTPIPMTDIISTIEWLLSLSNSVDIADINMSQRINN